VNYTRFITIENVCRDGSDNVVDTYGEAESCSSGTDDPLTQKLTVTLQAPNMADLSAGVYTTRWRNVISGQSDWRGGEADQSSLGESTQHFAIAYNEDDGDRVRGHVCKTADPPLGQLCPGGSWADSAEWITVSGGGGTIDLFYTLSSIGVCQLPARVTPPPPLAENTMIPAIASCPEPLQLTLVSFVPLAESCTKPVLIEREFPLPRASTVVPMLFVQPIAVGTAPSPRQTAVPISSRSPAPTLAVEPDERGDAEPVPEFALDSSSNVHVGLATPASNSWISTFLVFALPDI